MNQTEPTKTDPSAARLPEPALHVLAGFFIYLAAAGFVAFLLLPGGVWLADRALNLSAHFDRSDLLTFFTGAQALAVHLVALVFLASVYQTRGEGEDAIPWKGMAKKYQAGPEWRDFIEKQKSSPARVGASLVVYAALSTPLWLLAGWRLVRLGPGGGDMSRDGVWVWALTPFFMFSVETVFLLVMLLVMGYALSAFLVLDTLVGPLIVAPLGKIVWKIDAPLPVWGLDPPDGEAGFGDD